MHTHHNMRFIYLFWCLPPFRQTISCLSYILHSHEIYEPMYSCRWYRSLCAVAPHHRHHHWRPVPTHIIITKSATYLLRGNKWWTFNYLIIVNDKDRFMRCNIYTLCMLRVLCRMSTHLPKQCSMYIITGWIPVALKKKWKSECVCSSTP